MLAAARGAVARLNARAATRPLGAAVVVATAKNTAADLIVQKVQTLPAALTNI